MLPDYPHKLFADKRNHFELLMETLAMHTLPALKGSNVLLPAE
jgi:hypothetical protein